MNADHWLKSGDETISFLWFGPAGFWFGHFTDLGTRAEAATISLRCSQPAVICCQCGRCHGRGTVRIARGKSARKSGRPAHATFHPVNFDNSGGTVMWHAGDGDSPACRGWRNDRGYFAGAIAARLVVAGFFPFCISNILARITAVV